MPNVVDLFCGCGGLSYGFEQEGFKTVLGIDHDKAAIETFKLNHQDAKTILGDIREVSNEQISETTDNPIESGSEVTDHIINKPIMLRMVCQIGGSTLLN